MHGHILAKGGDVLWELMLRLGLETVDPEPQRGLRRTKEPLPLAGIEFMSQRDG